MKMFANTGPSGDPREKWVVINDNVASATTFLQYLNTRHPNINFTNEFEENHEIPFLVGCPHQEGVNGFASRGCKWV